METNHPLRVWREAQKEVPDGKGMKNLADVAKAVGVVPSHISQIETGEREPSLSLASRLSKLTQIPIDRFVRRRENAA